MTDEPLRATISQKAALFGPGGDVLLLRGEAGWEFPGGRIGADETLPEGLRREIREETGLTVTVGPPVHTVAWENSDGRGRFGVVYRCRTDGRSVRLSEEHDDWAWLAPAAALDRLSGAGVTALERALDRGALEDDPGDESESGTRSGRPGADTDPNGDVNANANASPRADGERGADVNADGGESGGGGDAP